MRRVPCLGFGRGGGVWVMMPGSSSTRMHHHPSLRVARAVKALGIGDSYLFVGVSCVVVGYFVMSGEGGVVVSNPDACVVGYGAVGACGMPCLPWRPRGVCAYRGAPQVRGYGG